MARIAGLMVFMSAVLLFVIIYHGQITVLPTVEAANAVETTDASSARASGSVGGAEQTDNRTIVLITTVHDKHGRIVTDLEKSDFVVHEDGVAQTITQFSREVDRKKGGVSAGACPLSLIIMLDLSGSMDEWGKYTFARLIIDTILDSLDDQDEVCLITFSDLHVQTKVGFTHDRSTISKKLRKLRPYGETAIFQAINFLPDLIAKARSSRVDIHMTEIYEPLPSVGEFLNRKRQAVILLTDGIDNKSIVSLKNALVKAKRIEMPIYTMVLAWQGEKDSLASQEYARTDVLEKIATETGGKYTEFGSEVDFETALAPVLEELRFQYLIGYISNQKSVQATWRQIDVSIREGADYRVITRKGYYSGR